MSSISSSKVISPTAYARKDYAYMTLSANQTTDVANNNPVKFNTVVMNNMEFNPVTYRVTLKANKLYCISSALYTLYSANTGYAQYRIYDVTNATFIGTTGTSIPLTYATHQGTQENLEHYIRPATDIVIEIRLSSVNSLHTIYAIGSYFKIQEIETSSPMVQTYQYAYVSEEMDLSVTGSNTWATTKARGVFKKTSNGFWELTDLVIYGTVASGARTSQDITIAGIVLRAYFPLQPLETATTGTPAGRKGYAYQADGKIYCDHASATTTWYSFGGIIKLNAKPTGYALPSDV